MQRISTYVVASFVLILGACGGRDWEAEYGRSQSELESVRGDLESAQARIGELEGENEQMRNLLVSRGQDVDDLSAARENLQRELDSARERERRQQERLAALRSMAGQLREMVAAGQLRVRIVRGNMVVELPENVLFDSGRADLREAGEQALEQLAQVLASVPNRDFLVAGHTDNVPIRRRRRFDSNWELSAARGVAVVRFLGDHGVPQERLAAAGYADTRPVASNNEDAGRAQNRRIEIIVMPNLDELPDLSELASELGNADQS